MVQRVKAVPVSSYEASQSGTYRTGIRSVLARPHPVLSLRAVEVDPCDPAIVALADALVATMRVSPACCGLAAPQVGESVRVFCMDLTGHKKARSCAGLVVMVNPRIVDVSGSVTMREGCMSVPNLTGNVTRPRELVVEGAAPGTGAIVRVFADEMEARCLLHEIDHLDGFVFVDRVENQRTDLFARKTFA